MKKLSALCIALLLAACGDSGNGIGSGGFLPGGGNNPTPPAGVTDAFYTRVLNMIGTTNESDDPMPLDDVVTSPEDADPVILS